MFPFAVATHFFEAVEADVADPGLDVFPTSRSRWSRRHQAPLPPPSSSIADKDKGTGAKNTGAIKNEDKAKLEQADREVRPVEKETTNEVKETRQSDRRQ